MAQGPSGGENDPSTCGNELLFHFCSHLAGVLILHGLQHTGFLQHNALGWVSPSLSRVRGETLETLKTSNQIRVHAFGKPKEGKNSATLLTISNEQAAFSLSEMLLEISGKWHGFLLLTGEIALWILALSAVAVPGEVASEDKTLGPS